MDEINEFIGDKKWMSEEGRPDDTDWRIAIALLEKPITEHPDVQRLISKQVQLQAKYDTLKQSHEKLVFALKTIRKTEGATVLNLRQVADQALKEAEKIK